MDGNGKQGLGWNHVCCWTHSEGLSMQSAKMESTSSVLSMVEIWGEGNNATILSMVWWKQKVKDFERSDITQPERETRFGGLMVMMLSH